MELSADLRSLRQQYRDIAREIGESPAERLRQRRGEAASLGGLGNAYYSLGQYQRAIDFQQQYRDIAREIGESPAERLRQRWDEAASLFNLGNALARCDRGLEARQSYSDARELFQELGLDRYVEVC